MQVCDDVTNTCACGWDGGDCCAAGADRDYCERCECRETTTLGPTTNATTAELTTPGVCIDGKTLYAQASAEVCVRSRCFAAAVVEVAYRVAPAPGMRAQM
jgi:hypothetical protein